MLILPAIDLYGGRAVRLYKGDYDQMTVYSDQPAQVAMDFARAGARWVHIVDLEGARDGGMPNMASARRIIRESGLMAEVVGGVRSMDAVRAWLDAGASRVILGTAAVTDPDFLARAAAECGEKLAVGVDLKDGNVAIKGWREDSGLDGMAFCRQLQDMGVGTVICTDISRDGAMRGANHDLYAALSRELSLRIVASGGVSGLDDILRLKSLGLYGAIVGKAYYTGGIDLARSIEVAK